MKRCTDFDQDLVALAHGGEAPEAQAHAAVCKRCAKRLTQHRSMAQALAVPTWLPPVEALRRAQSIMPPPKRSVARLVRSTFGLAGARYSGEESFQLMFEAEALAARLMFEKGPQGWTITGRIEGSADEAQVGETLVPLDEEGRFTTLLAKGARAEILVRAAGREIALPLPPEVTSGGPERTA